jgi:CheY-like chemotaxis protein
MDVVPSRVSRFLAELKRRHVFRIASAYVVVALAVGGGASLFVDGLSLPPWTLTFVLVCLILGFPIALVLAWAYDITPTGVRRTDTRPSVDEPTRLADKQRGARSARADRRGAAVTRLPARQTGLHAMPRPPETKELYGARAAEVVAPPPEPVPPDPERVQRASLAQLRDELRTPANAIVGYSRALLEQARAPERAVMRADLEKLRTAGELFVSRVESLLDPGHATWDHESPDREALLSRLRHDLRTPLNAIIGYSELVLEEEIDAARDEAIADDLRRITTAARRVLATIEEVVRFAASGQIDGVGLTRTSALALEVLAKIAPVQEAAVPLRQGRLLVVDDVEANRELIAHQLARQGYTVAAAANGRDALDLLAVQEMDLILLDILMPEMDGVEVLRRLKSDAALSDVPVIVISALDDVDSVVRCIQMGAEDFVTKPFDPVLLGARIGTILEVRRLRERERAYAEALRREQEWVGGVLGRTFPAAVAEKIKAGDSSIVESAAEATVLVAGLQGSALTRGAPAVQIGRLGELFVLFDGLAEEHDIEMIKTTGQCYVAVAGIPAALQDHARIIADLALAMQEETRRFAQESNELLRLRIGIHTGPVVAGLIVSRRLSFDLWGDGVETALHLQLHAAGGSIEVSPSTYSKLHDAYSFVSRGVVDLPGAGQMRTYVLQGRLEAVEPPAR